MPVLRKSPALLTLSVIFLASNFSARAQESGRIREPVDDQQVIRIEHTKHPLALSANSVGRVEADTNLERMILVLGPSAQQEEELKRLLDDLQKKSSPNFQRDADGECAVI